MTKPIHSLAAHNGTKGLCALIDAHDGTKGLRALIAAHNGTKGLCAASIAAHNGTKGLCAPVTRRAAIGWGWGAVAAACAPAWAFAAKEFWNERKPEEWTDEERQELLTKSPWAKEASTSFFGGPNVAGGRTATTNRGRRTIGTSTGGGPAPDPGKLHSIVRWESALPIREANHNESKDDPAANYILNVSGDLPMLGPASDDETEDEFSHRLEPLKQFTKLEKRGDPIYLSDIRYKGKRGSEGTLFYFVRNDLITLSDHTVTFVTKLGPIDVKAKFSTHEMIYQGKLEL